MIDKGRENSSVIGVRSSDIVQAELNAVHRCYLSWRTVSLLPAYKSIPAGTLSTIGKTGQIPKKWRKKLRLQIYEPAPVCSVHGTVHCFDCENEIIKPIPKQRKTKPHSKIISIGKVTPIEEKIIMSMTPEERKEALLNSLVIDLPDDERLARVMKGWTE